MKLDLSKEWDLNRFRTYSDKLIESGSRVELKKFREKRSISQNAYFHVCVKMIAEEIGDTENEVKQDLKREYGLYYMKDGKQYYEETSDLDTEQMKQFTDWIRLVLGPQRLGMYIPSPEAYLNHQFEIESQIK